MNCARVAGLSFCFLAVAAAPLFAQPERRSQDPDDYKGYRFFHYTRKAARGGNKLTTEAASFFGARDHEEFTAVKRRSDGRILAFGNAWGPSFPSEPEPEVLGKGQWYEVSEFRGGSPVDPSGKQVRVAGDYPNKAGFIAVYSADLRTLRRVVKFDWSVATIDAAHLLEDDSLIISGTSTHHFRRWVDRLEIPVRTKPVPGEDPRRYGKIYYQGVRLPGDAYLAKLSPDGKRLEWVWIFEGRRRAIRKFFRCAEGGFYCDYGGLRRVPPDGSELESIRGVSGRHKQLLDVHPTEGRFLTGGDRNNGTGREPWRRPCFHEHRPNGEVAWQVYDWPGPLVGHNRFRLVSDSSVRKALYAEDGTIWVVGWSDGGNTVFSRSPIDLRRPNGGSYGFGMSSWGATVGSFTHILRIDPVDFDVKVYCFWATYLIYSRDKPNSTSIHKLTPMKNGSLAMFGGAASGLIQTPENYYPDQWKTPDRFWYGGSYVTVFNRDCTNMRFSSYVPGVRVRDMIETDGGRLCIVGRSKGDDGRADATPSPIVRAIQPKFGGGRFDAHIFLLGPKREDVPEISTAQTGGAQ